MGPLVIQCFRHGESFANAGLVSLSPGTVPLTDAGVAQARAIARSFVAAPEAIICSSYDRSQKTAEPTSARYPGAPLSVWPIHEFTFLAPERHTGTTAEIRSPFVERYWERGDPHYVDGEGAESFAGFMNRVEGSIARFSELRRNGVKSVALFGHGLWLLAFQLMVEAGEIDIHDPAVMALLRSRSQTSAIPNGKGLVATFDGKRWAIAAMTLDPGTDQQRGGS